jgi:hypothetical protein
VMLPCNVQSARTVWCSPRLYTFPKALSPSAHRSAVRCVPQLKLVQGRSVNIRSFNCRIRMQRVAATVTVYSAVAYSTAALTTERSSIQLERNGSGLQRLRYQKEGWKYWNWKDSKTGPHRVHYISAGEDNPGPTVLLIHGFGASAYHWRHNIPALVDAGRRVFAVDLLGAPDFQTGSDPPCIWKICHCASFSILQGVCCSWTSPSNNEKNLHVTTVVSTLSHKCSGC